MITIKLLKDAFVNGEHRAAHTLHEVGDHLAYQLIRLGHAIEHAGERMQSAPVETAKADPAPENASASPLAEPKA